LKTSIEKMGYKMPDKFFEEMIADADLDADN
jgi:hypothetical protein